MTDTVAVSYQCAPIVLELTAKGLIGGKTLLIEDESGLLQLKVPAQLWEYIQPGDKIHMTFSPVKVTVTPVELPPLLSGLHSEIN